MSSGFDAPGSNSPSNTFVGAQTVQEVAVSNRSHWWFLAICGMFMLVGIMFLAWMGTAPVHSAIGKQLPELNVQGLFDADDLSPAKLDSNRTVILHLWGPWNPECQKGFPAMVGLSDRMKQSPDFQVLSVAFPKGALNVAELRSQVQDFFQSLGAALPTFFDSTGQTSMDLALMMPYGSLGFPTTLVVDPSGKVVFVMEGYSPEKFDQLQEFLDKRLAEHE